MDQKDREQGSLKKIQSSNLDSDIPTLKIESENSSETPKNEPKDHPVQKDEPTTSNGKDEEKNSSRHLAVSSKENRMLRTSSLKIEKSPDKESSSDKKIVRFADALGLDLEDVKVFKNDGSLPRVPSYAFNDLNIRVPGGSNTKAFEPQSNTDSSKSNYVLVPQFEQPVSDSAFINRVKENKVCLENLVVDALEVTGVVRISNLHYKKVVLVRYTTDSWISIVEHPAKYVEGSSDTVTDKFTFTIHPHHIQPGDKFIFVLKYEVLGQVFWDNNNSNNYTLLCKKKDDSAHLDSKDRRSVSK